jgi:hypothetical protein
MSANVIPVISGPAQDAPPVATAIAAPPATTGAASAAQQQAPPPKDNFAPRKFSGSAPSSSSTGLPDVLRLVSTQPMHTQQNLANSHFIPSTINFFAMLATMDAQMSTTHKFTQSNPNWHPLVSQLYISLLIYIQIIRCMIEADPLNTELIQFYDILYRHLGLESLVVPGPLVAFFAAITYTSSPFEWIGNICPTLPASTGASSRNSFRLNNRLYMMLPSIPFIIDQMYAAAAYVLDPATTEQTHATNWNRVYNIFTNEVNNTSNDRFNMLTPNARFPVFVPYSQLRSFALRFPSLGLPTRLSTDSVNGSTNSASYLQFFGFEAYYNNGTGTNWLQTIGPIMSSYSTFFQQSVSLMSISPTGLGASLPIAKYDPGSLIIPDHFDYTDTVPAQPPALRVPPYFRPNVPVNNTADIHHSAPNLSELAEQYAAVALINCDFTDTAANSTTFHGPNNATIRTGHYWTFPSVRASYELNTQPGFANNVASYYHVSTPVRK